MPFHFLGVIAQIILLVIALWFVIISVLLVIERILLKRVLQKDEAEASALSSIHGVANGILIGLSISFAVVLIAGATAIGPAMKAYDSFLDSSGWSEDAGFGNDAPGAIGRTDVNVGPPKTINVPADHKTIQEALSAANSGDTIVVQDGTYDGIDNRNLDFEGKAITLRSENGPDNCIIDCERYGRGFYFHSRETSASVLDGFTIMNARISGAELEGYGGGIFCVDSSSPTILNCIIKNNHALAGGGVCAYGNSSPGIRDCTISGNRTRIGGGISLHFGASPAIENCIIVDNGAGSGGSIYIGKESHPRITGCTFRGNSTEIFTDKSSNPVITDCTYE